MKRLCLPGLLPDRAGTIVDGGRSEPRRDGLLEDEQRDLQAYAWLPQTDLARLAGLQPPHLLDVLADLANPG